MPISIFLNAMAPPSQLKSSLNPAGITWDILNDELLQEYLDDPPTMKMVKFDERQHCQHAAMQAAIQEEEHWQAEEVQKVKEAKEHRKAEECRKAEEAAQRKAAKEKGLHELEAEKKRLKEETHWAQQVEGSSSQHVASVSGRPAEQAKACSACIKAREPCVPGTGCSKSGIQCQKTKGKCDLNPKVPESEKPASTVMSPQGGEKRKWRKSAHFGEPADDEDLDDTADVKVISKPHPPCVQSPHQDPLAEVLDCWLGEIINVIQRNTAAVESMLKEVKDLSRVLEELFEILKTMTTSLINQDSSKPLEVPGEGLRSQVVKAEGIKVAAAELSSPPLVEGQCKSSFKHIEVTSYIAEESLTAELQGECLQGNIEEQSKGKVLGVKASVEPKTTEALGDLPVPQPEYLHLSPSPCTDIQPQIPSIKPQDAEDEQRVNERPVKAVACATEAPKPTLEPRGDLCEVPE
ncbi:hypothetical protein EDD16DRAFT_1720030 [Pisolithus croceorrhizus]|nr:hypothetical protein EV401DRAFT_2084050 [Pisolithus croceorrhizus]KAI6096279.1 hypothetical protein EDD16DRAFT_1720030 [Pisolithus croceorrhizus]KAI6137918.1 hypothetical protein EDD17DRAFT_1771145 [Pisolithus thermaeus]